MSLELITARLATINAGITGITTASEDPPNKIDGGEVPWVFSLPSSGTMDYAANDYAENVHTITMQVWGRSIGTERTRAQAIDELKVFVNRFRDKYAANIALNELSCVAHAYLTAYRFGTETYGTTERAVLEFDIVVTEKGTVTIGL